MKRTLFLTIFIVVGSVIGIFAQSHVSEAVQNAKDRFSEFKNRSNELERMRRDADTPVRPATHEVKFPEIKEDFEQIQIINNDLQPNAALANPDLQAVYKAAGEIRKHALRLQSNLFVPDNKKKSKKKVVNADDNAQSFDLKNKANALEIAISNFIKNSMFQNIQVVNSEDSQRAQKDLENIIKLSEAIERQTANHENNK
ncbi:MAG: hypothetical protein ABI954_06895 [Pyrinomonadaceae bacterium]